MLGRVAIAALVWASSLHYAHADDGARSAIQLPAPRRAGALSLEEALSKRRSRRRVSSKPLSLRVLGQLLWAAQGVTSQEGLRTTPSAGARYPLEVYVVLGEGVYCYQPREHRLRRIRRGDVRAAMWRKVYSSPGLADAPAIFVIAGNYARTASKYGERAPRYVHIEVGHAGQNLLLQGTALGLHGVGIGAFSADHVKRTLGLPANHEPLYVVPMGEPP